MTKLLNPVPLFLDGRGALLDAGFVYIGIYNTDPEVGANQLPLFTDPAMTIPIDQPLRTLGGIIVDGANPVFVYFAATDYSIVVRDADENLVASIPSATESGGIAYQPLDSDLSAIAALATTAYGRSFLVLADQAALQALVGIGSAGLLAKATAAQYRAATADKVITTDIAFAAAVPVALASVAGSVAVDFNSGINFTLAMTENTTLAAPTNAKPGQSGFIEITQNAGAAKTLGFHANWIAAGAVDPTISTTLSARDVINYEILSDGKPLISINKAVG